jgi:phosphoribosylanthranilate isomerase
MRTRVKICGITTLEDLQLAVDLGADAIGFNCFPQSPRFIGPEDACLMIESLPPFVSAIGLFVNEEAETVAQACTELPFDALQFSGDEDIKFCRQFGKPFIKALRISSIEDFNQMDDFPDAEGFLFDAHVEGLFGGTGKRIDAALLSSMPVGSILAGGLNGDNVGEVIASVSPFAVDVSSGVESAPGKKDEQKMREFFNAVTAADRSKT